MCFGPKTKKQQKQKMKQKIPCQSWQSNPGCFATHSDALHLVHKSSVSIVVKLFNCLNAMSRKEAKVAFAGHTRSTNSFFCLNAVKM